MNIKSDTGHETSLDIKSEDNDSDDIDSFYSDDNSEREDSSKSSRDESSEDEELDDTPVLAGEAADDSSDGGASPARDCSVKMPSESLAAVMNSILTRKPAKHKVILAKAKTDKQLMLAKRLKRDETNDDDDDDDGDKKVKVEVKTEIKTEYDERKEREMKKKLWTDANRVKPDTSDREKERNLQRIATRGVVQLFNAVAKQQKLIDEQMKEAGSSERKRDTVLKTMTKGKFLDVLKTTSVPTAVSQVKVEVKKEDDATWSILRDDFMMGAKMKDWDKMSDNEEHMDTCVVSTS